jgi:hypothetical protein
VTEPACWSWPLPPLPLPNRPEVVADWQAGRCAICGVATPVLHLDHDHATGESRGWLCPGAAEVYNHYRARPPFVILGVADRYGASNEHPTTRDARVAWESAFINLDLRRREQEAYDRSVASCAYLAVAGLDTDQLAQPYRPLILDQPLNPLEEYILRVGLTGEEWHGEYGDRWRFRNGWVRTEPHRGHMRAELIRWARERREGTEEWVRGPNHHLYERSPYYQGD